jgi:CheY-like chemotaxis protein
MSDMQALRGRHILVVEDEYVIAADLAQTLEELGALVIGPIGTLAEGIEAATNAPCIDAAALDLNLGSEKAYPIASALQARGVPFVFATGYDGWVLPPEFAEVPRCEKPVDTRALARLLGSTSHARRETSEP